MNTLSFKQTQRGFTLLEMVIVIVLIGFLGVIVLDRVWKYRVYAEEAAVTAVIGNIRSALGLEIAKLTVRGQSHKIINLQNTNPMDLLSQTPHNYIGTINNPATLETSGIWYYDKNKHILSYIVNFPESFKSNIKGRMRTRHKIKLIFTDRNHNNKYDKYSDDITGIDLVALEHYRWVVEK